MSLGTKNRLAQTAALCKAHLREQHRDQLVLVEEFIIEIEGTEEAQDLASWNQFADVKRSTAEMIQRLDAAFAKWLEPG